MRLGLCSGALPDAPLKELCESAARRGLSVVELREGDAHGIAPTGPMVAAARLGTAGVEGVEVTGFRVTGAATPLRLARLGEVLNVAILVDGSMEFGTRLQRACRIAGQGISVAVVVRGLDAIEQARAVRDEGLDVAWDVDAVSCPPGRTVAALLDEVGPRLRHVRLQGGGPEAALHEGRGIGEMTGRLALAGYDGTLTLTPTSTRYRIAWQGWLGRRGGWGCGSKTADPELVALSDPEPWKGVHR